MHLTQLELCLGSSSGWESQVANHVPKSLSIIRQWLAWYQQDQEHSKRCLYRSAWRFSERREYIPLRFMLCENLSLGVITNDLDVDEAPQIQLLWPEHRHAEEIGKLKACSRQLGLWRRVDGIPRRTWYPTTAMNSSTVTQISPQRQLHSLSLQNNNTLYK